MGNFLKEALKDKNKLLMLVPLLLGVLFVIVFFGKKEKPAESASNTEEVNQAFLEPDTEGEKKIANKVDAYKREQEEAARKKRELCRFRTSLRSGTIMESSKLPFLVWYKTMFLMSCTKKGFSTNELQKQLGLKRYEPVWAMVHKLRRAMGNRDARYTLEGMIELDEGYFSVASKEIERGKGTRGRGAEGKQNVAVMAESTPLEDIETGKKEKHVRYFKARVLDSHQSEGINGVVRDCMEDDAIVFSDKSTSYVDISDLVELHVTEKSDAKTTKETLKWVHIAISNAKRTLLGNYHKIKRKYLQLYLNEFIYKLNRRYFGDKLFDRLVIANITGA